MKATNEIIEHGKKLLAIFPDATEQDPVLLSRKLRKLEVRAGKLAEAYCNGDIDGTEWEAESVKLRAAVVKILGCGETFPVFVNADARGYALKIAREAMSSHKWDLAKDWGGYGLLAPDLR
ncbi:MAG TPA: hypothetical protein PL064_10600 [Thermogutta sp.]|nr:hypothetical protein [Thermogutta sp.]